MTSALEIMTPGIEFRQTTDTAADAAKKLPQVDIGALPVCEPDGHLTGMVTDRDIVVKVVAEAKDPKKTRLAELADQPEVVTIGADGSVEEVFEVMKKYKVRRLPVIDGTEVVGVISQADLARNLPNEKAGEVLAAISQ
jgi:CBS domain-containing protein